MIWKSTWPMSRSQCRSMAYPSTLTWAKPTWTAVKMAGEPAGKGVRQLRAEDFERKTPIYCVWEITLACDLGCRHCGSRAGDSRPDELSTDECLEVVAQ